MNFSQLLCTYFANNVDKIAKQVSHKQNVVLVFVVLFSSLPPLGPAFVVLVSQPTGFAG